MDCTGQSQQMIKPIKVVINGYHGIAIRWRDGSKTTCNPDTMVVVINGTEVHIEDLIKFYVEVSTE